MKKIFTHTDSRKKNIYKITVNSKLKIIKKKIFLKFNKKIGSPDGMTLDTKKKSLGVSLWWFVHYSLQS